MLIFKADLFIGEWGEVPLAVEAEEQEVGEEGGAGQGGQGDLEDEDCKKLLQAKKIEYEKPECGKTDLLLRMDEGDEDDGLHGGEAAHDLGRKIELIVFVIVR